MKKTNNRVKPSSNNKYKSLRREISNKLIRLGHNELSQWLHTPNGKVHTARIVCACGFTLDVDLHTESAVHVPSCKC